MTLHYRDMIIAIVWIILTLISHQQESYAITVTINNDGQNSTECCVDGNCPCSSLFNALQNIKTSTIINITSESVKLHNYISVITRYNFNITGNNVVIKCDNIGSVSFVYTINVTIHGITWDQCGNLKDSDVDGGISFVNNTFLIIDNCTFQHSQMCALSLSTYFAYVTIKSSSFISNGINETIGSGEGNCGGLKINIHAIGNIVISDSVFSGNGKSIGRRYYPIYGLFITMSEYNQGNSTLIISRTSFVSNFGGMYLNGVINALSTITLSEVSVLDNTDEGILLSIVHVINGNVNLMLLNSNFNNNGNGGFNGVLFASDPKGKVNVTVKDCSFMNNRAVNFSNKALEIVASSTDLDIYVQDSVFANNSNGTIYITSLGGKGIHLVNFHKVVIEECFTMGSYSGNGAVYIFLQSSYNNTYYFQSVLFISNNYLGITGGALFLKTANAESDIFMINCVFQNNNGMGHGAAFYVADGVVSNPNVYQTVVYFINVSFINNIAGSSVVYVGGGTINNTKITAESTLFVNNNGTALHLFMSQITFYTNVVFENNTANSGPALYLEQGTQVYFDNKYGSIVVRFVNNSATQYGGAIYTDLPFTCPYKGAMFHDQNWNLSISYINNTAGVIGNSLYFNINEFCVIDTNVSDINSLLYYPYKFNYSEARTTAIVTSPDSVVLYFPNHDGSYIGSNEYFIRKKILGKAITFTGAVFDYFNNSAEPIQFRVKCLNDSTNYILANHHDWLLIDNVSLLNITISGNRIDLNPVNVTFSLTSVLASFNKQISLQLVIELLPCFSGYFYNGDSRHCVCYHHKDIVECYNDYNEIKRGYWFGAVTDPFKPSVSLCPSRYCYFGKHRKETRKGYCILPSRLDDQCNSQRTGIACGHCKPGYTLAYDSPKCIGKDKCSAGMTVLVIVLTILYWIAIVVVVFALMHFKPHVSSGYVYGVIYYYSIVDILLDNNAFISDTVFQVIAVLSSFAKLTPQLFGQLCLVKGLRGIDQQFIHYSHAFAISLILLIIVIAARYFPRLAFYVRRYIIRVICILLLLSYTSLASTSFQLLQPIYYPGYEGIYVYISPDMKYFNNRHAFYGVVALLCCLFIVIGLPVILLLEPLILGRWFNFVRIKPLLDQFQGCYKDEYRWFAAFYLICRQVIIIIVYFSNDDYYEMLYYLQTACVVIAMLHIWIQPYTDNFLNAFDGIVLLTLILAVNVNTFTFLSSATSVIIIILVFLPLVVFCIPSIKRIILCKRSQNQQLYNLVDDADHADGISNDRDNIINYGR